VTITEMDDSKMAADDETLSTAVDCSKAKPTSPTQQLWDD